MRYRVRAIKSGLKGPWTESNEVTTICPPLAPSIRGVRAAYATGSTATLEWVPNHPDGSAQASAEVQVTTPTGSTTTTVDGPGASLKLPTGTKGLYTVRVRTKGLDEDWGAWSSAAAYTVADAPQAFFTDPAADGATLRAVPHTFTWKVADETGVSRQHLSLRDIRGNILWSGMLDKDARSFRLGYAQHAFVNHTVYRVVLTVTAGSSLSVAASRVFQPNRRSTSSSTRGWDASCRYSPVRPTVTTRPRRPTSPCRASCPTARPCSSARTLRRARARATRCLRSTASSSTSRLPTPRRA